MHRHTGSTTFQRTTDIGHTVNLRVAGHQFGGSTGEEALVHFLHTRDHHFVYGKRSIGHQTDALRLLQLSDGHLLRVVAQIGDYHHISGQRIGQLILTVNISDSAHAGRLQHERSTYERFAFLIDDDALHGFFLLRLNGLGTVDIDILIFDQHIQAMTGHYLAHHLDSRLVGSLQRHFEIHVFIAILNNGTRLSLYLS